MSYFLKITQATTYLRYLYIALLLCAAVLLMLPFHMAHGATVYLTSGSSWTVPVDWNSSNNTIEVIGGGGGGHANYGAGGGGAYSSVNNVSLTSGGSISYSIGSGGSGGNGGSGSAGGDTFFCASTSNCASIAGSAVVVGAKGGGAGGEGPGGAGGSSSAAEGDVAYSGGAGGTSFLGGGGGGGAAGPNGAGRNGGVFQSSSGEAFGGGGGGGANGGSSTVGSNGTVNNGGNGGQGTGGSGGGSGGTNGNGGNGSNGGGGGGGHSDIAANGGAGSSDGTFGSSYGAGGGGGGAGGSFAGSGGNGGLYGGGGGGGINLFGLGVGGSGGQGLIVITYTIDVNDAPSTPSISGPTTGYTNTTYTFTLSGATDPDGDDIRYAIDWDNNGSVDEYAPSSGYVASGSSRDVMNDWSGEGARTFQVRAEDEAGEPSGWDQHTITLSVAPTSQQLSCSWTDPGTYQVRGIVVDSRGATSSFSSSFEVEIEPACTDCYPLSGYGWSSNIGWISLNCENTTSCGTSQYYIEAAQTGALSGYAWSPNIGWLSANQGDISGCPSGGTCTPRINPATGELLGWLRALAHTDSESGGWDGWVSLSCQNTGACGTSLYGPVLDFDTDAFAGFAWASDVTGWIDFQYASTNFEPLLPDTYSCLDENTLRYVAPDLTITDTLCPYAAYGYGCEESGGTAVCLVPPTPGPATAENDLRVTPRLVREGSSTQVSWDIENATECTVTADNTSDSWTGVSGSYASSPITTRTTFSLSCISDIDGFDYTAQASVNIAPLFEEI